MLKGKAHSCYFYDVVVVLKHCIKCATYLGLSSLSTLMFALSKSETWKF